DCLKPNLQRWNFASSGNDVRNRCPCPVLVMKHSRGNLPDDGAMPSEGIEGDEWAAYLALSRMAETNVGSPTGRESYGDGGLVVVAGVTPGQGGRESRPQGEGGQVIRT